MKINMIIYLLTSPDLWLVQMTVEEGTGSSVGVRWEEGVSSLILEVAVCEAGACFLQPSTRSTGLRPARVFE